ncbi:MAG TPA: serine hydrolase domain-containing protein, partial [Terriglobales bacterium]|nr:serine hydrolase domain-containing protein [Terriglobales bacterium]
MKPNPRLLRPYLAAFLCLITISSLASAKASKKAGVSLPQVDAIVRDAVAQHQVPGAVVLIGHHGHVIYRKAFGMRSLEPRRERMTVDTIFDLASLTKVIATTPCVMQLMEEGKIRLNDPVVRYIPEFGVNGKQDITVRQLLVHYSGLAPDLDLTHPWQGKETAYQMAFQEKPLNPPGARFVYSDINFIMLGALVERTSGMSLNDYAEQHVFNPLKMTHTQFLPPHSWIGKIAPTQYDEHNVMLRGVVHDPTARRMGGVA